MGFKRSSSEPKKCGYTEHPWVPFQGSRDEPDKPHCLTCGHHQGECSWHGKPECNEVRINGKHCFDHGTGRCCACHAKEPKKPVLRCKCGHDRPTHDKVTGCALPDCHCGVFRCDHSACGWKPREECQHPSAYNYGLASGPPVIRYFYCSACKAKWETEEQPEEPPLTPEEEEQAPPDRIHPADCVHEDGCQYMEPTCENACKAAADELVRKVSENACEDCLRGEHGPNAHREPPPPQPERRPPYLVAYSVSGHLFEVALPGDATVRAVDGALVIQHHLGPVAGIVSVLPVINKES